MGRTAGANAFTPPPDFDVDRGNCRGVDTAQFFPRERDWVPDEVQDLCDSCPVRDECLSYALESDLVEGIWGGTSWQQRTEIRRVVGYRRSL
jgi:WhiB family transcriptional regulator, redox-sensing transcriptional regulator